MGVIKLAIGDAVLTFLWVFCVSTLGVCTSLIASALGVQGLATLLITVLLVYVLVIFSSFAGDALGGASFNVTGNAALYVAGVGSENLISLAVRIPAQAAGAVGGALAISEVMPIQYKHMVGGPSLKVDLHTGALAEGILTFAISLSVLLITLRCPRSPLIKMWLVAMSIVALVAAGSGFTGPSMNPANAFGWAYLNNQHNSWEQMYVYWACPFVGAILAAWTFRLLFSAATPKQKKKKKA